MNPGSGEHRLHKERATTWRAAREWNRVESHCLLDPGRNESLSEHRAEKPKRYFILYVPRLSMPATFIHEQSSELCKARKHEKTWELELGTWGGNYKRSREKSSRKEDIVFLKGERGEGKRERDIKNQSLKHFLRYRANFVGILICWLIMEQLPRIIFVSKKR